VHRRRWQSLAARRVVRVRTGLLSQVVQGEKRQARATRKCPVYRALSGGEAGKHQRFGQAVRPTTVAGQPIAKGGNHRQPTESCASVQDFSLKLSRAESSRSAHLDLPELLGTASSAITKAVTVRRHRVARTVECGGHQALTLNQPQGRLPKCLYQRG
jgi:hypothetical protein